MTQTLSADEVMEAFVRLSEDEQEDLYDLLRRRRTEANAMRLLAIADVVHREYADGKCVVATPAEILREALS